MRNELKLLNKRSVFYYLQDIYKGKVAVSGMEDFGSFLFRSNTERRCTNYDNRLYDCVCQHGSLVAPKMTRTEETNQSGLVSCKPGNE